MGYYRGARLRVLTKGRPKRHMSESIDQRIEVKFDMLKRVAPYRLMNQGMIV
jgi:hypothetical protein